MQALDLAVDPELPSGVSAKRDLALEVTAQQYRDLLVSLGTPVKADPQEILSLESYRKAFRKFLKPPLTDLGLAEASTQLQALDAAIKRCEQRITRDEQTLLRKGQVLGDHALALQQLTVEPLPQDRIEIDKISDEIDLLTQADLPDTDDLAKAENAVRLLREAIEDALLHLVEDKKRRETERTELLQGIEQALLGVDAEVMEPEKSTIPDDAKTIKASLPESPSDEALGLAREALVALKKLILVAATRVQEVRKERFALAVEAGEKVKQLAVAPPAECPDWKPELNEARDQLAKELKPFLDWAQVTTWDAPALAQVASRIEPLGLLFESFRQEVAAAVEAIRIAAEAVTKAITSPAGEAFSTGQKSHFADALDLLVIDAKKAVLAAAPHIEKIKALQKQVEAVARVRNEVLKRLKLLPTPAPATATPTEQKRWTALRSAAVSAADEVVDA